MEGERTEWDGMVIRGNDVGIMVLYCEREFWVSLVRRLNETTQYCGDLAINVV